MQVKTLNIALPGELIEKVDEVAKREYKNRSEFIRQALTTYLRDTGKWEQIFKAGREAGRKVGIKSEADVDRIVYEYRHGKKSSKSSL